MTAAAALLAEARARGLTLTTDGEKVTYTSVHEAVAVDLIDRLREHKAELLKLLVAESVSTTENGEAEKTGQVLHTNFGAGYRHHDGRVESGQPEPMPRPTEPWPRDLDSLLRRVSVAFEWTQQDVADFRQWARRSPEGLSDARAFLEHEAAKLPAPGLSDHRRVVQDMLAADPSITYAWTCADDGSDPVTLTLAIRGKGTCELAIPRERFAALELPQLIDQLTQEDTP